MRNSPAVNPRLRRCSAAELLPLLLLSLIFSFPSSIQSASSKSDTTSSSEQPLQWRFLSENNLSSQSCLNPHLLMVTAAGTLCIGAEHGAWNEKPFKDAPEPGMQEDNHEILGTVNKTVPRTPNDSSGARPEIVPGSILVATQKLHEVYPFEGSKILIVKVNQTTGFQGLIINKLISWDAVSFLEEGLDPLKDAPLSYGGFLFTRGRPLLSLTRQSVRDEHPEVLPGIYFLDQLATANFRRDLKLHKRSLTDYWFFMGYSAWDWNQLLDEIADGSWNVIDGTVKQLDWPRTRWNFGSLFRRG